MGKVIYLCKLFILSFVCPVLTAAQTRNIERLIKFTLAVYGRNFLSTGVYPQTPLNHFNFFYELKGYASIDARISRKAIIVHKRHEWFLTEEQVAFAIFDSRIDMDDLQLMAATLQSFEVPNPFPLGKPAQPNFDPVTRHLTDSPQPLSVFFGPNSWLLFERASAFLRITQPESPDEATYAPIITPGKWINQLKFITKQ